VSDEAPSRAIALRNGGRAEHGIAWLRLAAVGLFAGAERLPPNGDNDAAFFAVLGVYAAWSVAILALTWRRAPTKREGLAATAVDIIAITALSMFSGGPFSLTRLGYFIVPVTAAFRYRPSVTLIATAVSIVAYLSQALLDIGPDQGNVSGFVALHAGMLAWVGAACAALSAAIARRSEEIARLAQDREQLLAEALAAETRERRALAEGLHDSAIQSLLASRHDLEEAAARAPGDPGLERADEALLGVVRELRAAIFELHPHVLEEAGLEAAIRCQRARSWIACCSASLASCSRTSSSTRVPERCSWCFATSTATACCRCAMTGRASTQPCCPSVSPTATSGSPHNGCGSRAPVAGWMLGQRRVAGRWRSLACLSESPIDGVYGPAGTSSNSGANGGAAGGASSLS
jgi:hypothetical protein